MFKKKAKTYADLYLRILQIGKERLQSGITYNELYNQLKQEDFDCGNDCIDLAVKHWFVESFFHVSNDIEIYTGINNIDQHKDCHFVLRGEHSLTLLDHQKSKNNLKIACIAVAIAFIGVVASIVQTEIALNSLKKSQESSKQNIEQPLNHESSKISPIYQIDSLKK